MADGSKSTDAQNVPKRRKSTKSSFIKGGMTDGELSPLKKPLHTVKEVKDKIQNAVSQSKANVEMKVDKPIKQSVQQVKAKIDAAISDSFKGLNVQIANILAQV